MKKNIILLLMLIIISCSCFNYYYTSGQNITNDKIPGLQNANFKKIKLFNGKEITFEEQDGSLIASDSPGIKNYHIIGNTIQNEFIEINSKDIAFADIQKREIIPFVIPINLLGIPIVLAICMLVWLFIHPPA